ncbi:MAG: hypothetical protein NTX45_08715 [Proteobacteria bacterium]|nr:hypothetical protein [Pseudomonadota bacterium]
MRSDTLIRHDGIQALRERLGPVEAERFIVLINRESFDYTKWQKTLWQNESVDELFAMAKKHAEQIGP